MLLFNVVLRKTLEDEEWVSQCGYFLDQGSESWTKAAIIYQVIHIQPFGLDQLSNLSETRIWGTSSATSCRWPDTDKGPKENIVLSIFCSIIRLLQLTKRLSFILFFFSSKYSINIVFHFPWQERCYLSSVFSPPLVLFLDTQSWGR